MRVFTAAVFALVLSTGLASADPCDTLIDMTNDALSAPNISGNERSQLEAILNVGRTAKAAGDVQACEAAMTSTTDGAAPPMSVPNLGSPGGARGHKCEKSLNTV
jgi:hypothetical protein